jgi:deazaflavin-dependent oxidoreductase (nitroreductase family)
MATPVIDSELATRLARVARKSHVTLTHYGRKSGKPYQVTIWFTVDGDHVNLHTMSMQRQWPRNVLANGRVTLRIGDETFEGTATPVDPADMPRVVALMKKKYLMSLPYLWIKKRPDGAFHVHMDARTKPEA